MKIIKNCLPEYLIDICRKEFNKRQNKDKTWSISENFWDESLLECIPGVSSQQSINGLLKEKILKELSLYLPKYDETIMQFYNWHKMSGIASHEDFGYSFGATLYLNTKWDPNWGGVFIWGEDKNNLTNAIIPQYNTLVINYPPMRPHLVTMISPLAPETRKTIQIWGDKQ